MSDPVNTASFGSLEDLPEDKMSRNEPHSDKYEVASKIYKERVAAARKRRQTPKEYNSDQQYVVDSVPGPIVSGIY